MDAQDIARALGVSERTVYRMLTDGEWPEMFWLRRKRVVPTSVFRRWAHIDD